MIGVTATHHVVLGDESPPRPTWLSAGQARRLDPLARCAASAVAGALTHGGIVLPADTALAVGTAYGSVVSTQRLLDGIATDGDELASPAAFSASVLSHIAGALGEGLGVHGPVATISQGRTSALAALRWAWLQLAADRASTALVLAADHHSPVIVQLISELIACPWPLIGGASAWILQKNAGREMRLGMHPAEYVIDGGAPDPRDEQCLVRASVGRTRSSAPAVLHGWYPTAVLAHPLPAAAVQLLECDRQRTIAVWCGPQ